MKKVIILAIDTSCDDTAVAILVNESVIANIVTSQTDIHKDWGGVVPNLARRAHEENLPVCINMAIKRAKITWKEINSIAVTYGPGLAPSLEVGIRVAKELALQHKKKIIAVNHMEGHILSPLLKNRNGAYYNKVKGISYPFIAMNISGGHTEIVLAQSSTCYEILGQTLDDAVGEAFDKVARMLDLGYPGGPIIEKIAQEGNKESIPFPRPMQQSKDYNMSFSGLKTASLYKKRDLEKEGNFEQLIPDFCASFQEAAVDSLLIKLRKACKRYKPTAVIIAGGVSANLRLREKFRKAFRKLQIPLIFPYKKFCMDNAAMIGLTAYYKYLRNEFVKDINYLDRDPALIIGAKNIYE